MTKPLKDRMQVPLARSRIEAVERLAGRREEIEETIGLRALAVAEPSGTETPGYAEGLRAAIAAAVEYALVAIERGADRAGRPPAAVLAQARAAARSGVGLEVVLRRYAAGYSALGDFLGRETRHLGVAGTDAYQLHRELTALFDRLVEAVSDEYRDEQARVPRSSERRRSELITKLLGGELIDATGLEYALEGHHLAMIVLGIDGAQVIRDLASALDRRALISEGDGGPLSVWLGGRRPFGPEELEVSIAFRWPRGVSVAAGEPGEGPLGWRRSHRQARSAFALALRNRGRLTSYRDVALLTAVSGDEDLVAFLTSAYLAPLAAERDGGGVLRETLGAYFRAGRNVSAAAAALGLARQTVASRLQTVERRLGRPLHACGAELETTLRLVELDG